MLRPPADAFSSDLSLTDLLTPGSSQILLRDELDGRVWENDDTLLRTIYKVQNVPECLVDFCVERLQGNAAVQADFAELVKLAAEEKSEEVQMYQPLARILHAIRTCDSAEDEDEDELLSDDDLSAISEWDRSPSCTRNILITDKNAVQDDSDITVPKRCPDLSVVDEEDGATKLFWRLCSAFIEVKAKSKRDGTWAELIRQLADVARIHLAAKPFQLFSLALCICGTKLYATTWDRAGGVISREYDYCDGALGLELLVRIVLQLTRGLTPVELGQDPNVSIVPAAVTPVGSGAPSTRSTRSKKSGVSAIESAFPTYRVTFDGVEWLTDGLPIFQSISYIGRGTSVWRVTNQQRGTRILKSAWRASSREGEITIYQKLQAKLDAIHAEWPVGIAQVDDGGDVAQVGPADGALHISYLRPEFGNNIPDDPVLHRVLLKSIGRPLWRYQSDRQLVTEMLDAIKGHREMYRRGLLHRDISIGNVMLAVDPEKEGGAGFVTDVEFAKEFRVERPPPPAGADPDSAALGEAWVASPLNSSATPGAAMSGTAQFMAIELLRHYIDLAKAQQMAVKKPTLVQQDRHDLESFVWVLIYAIVRHEMLETAAAMKAKLRRGDKITTNDAKAIDNIRQEFQQMFGQASVKEILRQRVFMCSENIDSIQVGPIANLVHDLQGAVATATSGVGRHRPAPIPLTYELLIATLEECLVEINQAEGTGGVV